MKLNNNFSGNVTLGFEEIDLEPGIDRLGCYYCEILGDELIIYDYIGEPEYRCKYYDKIIDRYLITDTWDPFMDRWRDFNHEQTVKVYHTN